ncbi:hypothetical protein P280DRAFT_508717 [Massarina eburnea CBS 473.64]|uniref:Uncharacterized protein n=1 Tax=Massarina eburnea CBS 473.64 TaxID=1395130 RepID=A0A6A6RU00_9PLEO|nr:hypothetical protein P280DRAFT_508717 [Massarina eburnea CBS 473.64]
MPCVLCYEESIHKPDCRIDYLKSVNPYLLPVRQLYAPTKDELEQRRKRRESRRLPKPESLNDRFKGMAEIVRNEMSYKKDDDLHGLSDQSMVMAWALKQVGGTVIYPNGEISINNPDCEGSTEDAEDISPEAANERWDAFEKTWEDGKDGLASLTPEDLDLFMPDDDDGETVECEECDKLVQDECTHSH